MSKYLYGSNVCVLRDVLVLVKPIFCRFAFAKIDGQFDEEKHDRLQRGDGAVARSLGGDMFVQDIECGLGLINGDELLCSL